MKSVAVIAIATVLLLTGCRKDQLHSNEDRNGGQDGNLSTMSAVNPVENPLNPWDSLGRLHNIILDSLRKYVKRSGDTTYAGRAGYLKEYSRLQRNFHYIPTYNYQLERAVCTDYKNVLVAGEFSPEGKAILSHITNSLEAIGTTRDIPGFIRSLKKIEESITDTPLPVKERNYLFVVAAVMRHSSYYWMNEFEQGYVTQKKGILGFLRKVAGVITGIAADATTAGYHYVKGSRIDHLVIESAWMSEICGYYTGWY